MEFSGEFRAPGDPDAVMARFADVERMARCMPGAVINGRGDDGSYTGAMVVAFGPKNIKFRGRATHEVDAAARSGKLVGRGAAELRAARIGVTVTYSVREDPVAAASGSIVSLRAEAELGGVLADFARTGGIPVANALMAEFARRLAEEFAGDAPAAMAPAAPLAAHRLLWDIVKEKLRRIASWLGLNTGEKHDGENR
jgi:carbon monoxide dehydrogenase subunit G